jgi:uncharacterized coiled-coil protein SlyX
MSEKIVIDVKAEEDGSAFEKKLRNPNIRRISPSSRYFYFDVEDVPESRYGIYNKNPYWNELDAIELTANCFVIGAPLQETSLERFQNTITGLNLQLIEKNKELENQKNQIAELKNKLETLRDLQKRNLPYKKLAKYSLLTFIFFSISFIIEEIIDIVLVTRFWNSIGLFFSFGFLLMALGMRKDWSKEVKED